MLVFLWAALNVVKASFDIITLPVSGSMVITFIHDNTADTCLYLQYVYVYLFN